MKRRDVLNGLAALTGLALLPTARARAATVTGPRTVVLDWGLAETLLALGATPVGMAEIEGYQASVVAPAVPGNVTDVGLRLTPSLELIQQLRPDLILINASQHEQRAVLERIAQVQAPAIYTETGDPYRRSVAITQALGQSLGCSERAEALIEQTRDCLATCARQLQGHRSPVYLLQFFDPLHMGVYGASSLFGDVLTQLGLDNAWQKPTDYWGIAVAGLEDLAARPDANVLYFGNLPPALASGLTANRVWQALPQVRSGRVGALPPFWGFGMLPSAMRFAESLSTALQRMTRP